MFSGLLYRKYLFLLKESPRHSQTIHQDSTHQQNIENLLYLNQRSVGVGTASVKMGYFWPFAVWWADSSGGCNT
jgi:hypothetical protein